MRVLVVEDDRGLADVLRRGLAEHGHVVDLEYDGTDGECAVERGAYDAVILDVMLPRRDGVAVAERLRARDVRTPILMLTARDTVEDTIRGLGAGADDYLKKPFVFAELLARLHSITRRHNGPVCEELRCGDLVMNVASRRVWRGTCEINLTAREMAFLEFFMRNAGLLITRTMLEDSLWERHRDTTSNIIEVYVRRLRSKLHVVGSPPLIETVRGAGYRFGSLAERA